jgi:hypothetical protein
MRRRRLGERLRALILATPLIAAPGCSKNPYELDSGCFDGIIQFVDAGLIPDSGFDCNPMNSTAECPCVAACAALGHYDVLGCFFEPGADGGTSLYCDDCYVPIGGRRPASLLASIPSMCQSTANSLRTRLGKTIKALAFATPLIGPACSTSPPFIGPCAPPDAGTFSLVAVGDGGRVDGAPCDYFFSACNDAGQPLACEGACRLLMQQAGIEIQPTIDGCLLLTLPDGGPALYCAWTPFCGVGRRPASLIGSSFVEQGLVVGDYFAQAARLEAASIPAFHVLAKELRAHRAPNVLVQAATRSAQDEVRHTRSTSSLARRYGAEPIRPTFGPMPTERSLEDIATENAVEGCVRETYGALVALWQACYAQDPVVRSAMIPIAADETRHAELAWEVAAWAEPRLSRAARHRVHEARARAIAELRDEVMAPIPLPLVALAGMPSAETASVLLAGLAGG